ncbi:vomeronasal type-2 receptor 26-like [Pelodytes ibericus]
MSNTTDATICLTCPTYQKSNRRRDGCIPKSTNFLSFEETMGSVLASVALIFAVKALAVLGIFVRYRETPIVKANNRNLSCLLLASLALCFLFTLLFIGCPTNRSCLLRQVMFATVLTVSLSTVLAKTIIVIIAFNATRPGRRVSSWIGTRQSTILVPVCSFLQVVLSLVWMVTYPPYLDIDTLSETDNIVLVCNEGSMIFFFLVIGYMLSLSLLSFFVAFLARNFPERFNEAKNISFSMLIFCSVWVSFIPAYLSSKGSKMVAVEIFAILSSGAGLLGCIFIPKCYIIFLRPELNKRAFKK